MKTDHLTDYDLVAEFISGNERSIEILINRHKNKVYTYILMLVKNQELAEDIFQDTFYKVIRSLRENRYKDDGRFIGWVLRIAHNLVIDHFRRQKNMRMVCQEDERIFISENNVDLAAEEKIIKGQIHSKVRDVIEYLPEEQREVVIMRHFLDMSFKEIANSTNVSINTALGRMRYALINMRKLIENNSVQVSA